MHGFGLTQKLDSIVLEGIKLILHIPTVVKFRASGRGRPGARGSAADAKHNFYLLDTTNSRAIEKIIEYFHNTMKGMKSAEFPPQL